MLREEFTVRSESLRFSGFYPRGVCKETIQEFGLRATEDADTMTPGRAKETPIPAPGRPEASALEIEDTNCRRIWRKDACIHGGATNRPATFSRAILPTISRDAIVSEMTLMGFPLLSNELTDNENRDAVCISNASSSLSFHSPSSRVRKEAPRTAHRGDSYLPLAPAKRESTEAPFRLRSLLATERTAPLAQKSGELLLLSKWFLLLLRAMEYAAATPRRSQCERGGDITILWERERGRNRAFVQEFRGKERRDERDERT
ncbi:hypothetical protein KM043_004345 [Ampulex compressa]|nr:hypothetical protein KM043_004345 [Ampulex compressa]